MIRTWVCPDSRMMRACAKLLQSCPTDAGMMQVPSNVYSGTKVWNRWPYVHSIPQTITFSLPLTLACGTKSLQLCPTLCDSMNWSPPGSSIHGMGFSTQEYWSGLPCPPPGSLPDPEIEPASPAAPALQGYSLPLCHWGSPHDS